MMEHLMLHFCSNGMSLCHRQLLTHGNVEFGMKPMPRPPDADLGDLVHLWYMPDRVADFFKHCGSTPSSRRVKIATPDSQPIRTMARAITNPTIESIIGYPNHAPIVPTKTAKLVQPSTRA